MLLSKQDNIVRSTTGQDEITETGFPCLLKWKKTKQISYAFYNSQSLKVLGAL